MSTEKLKLEVLLSAIDKVTGPFKTIAKGSGDAARALRAAKDELKALQKQQANIAAFKEADKAAAITANMFKAAQERVRLLKEEMGKVGVPTKAMTRALAEAGKEADDLKRRHAGLMDRQQALFAQMKAGGIDTRNLANHSRDLATRQIAAAGSVQKLSVALEAQNKTLARMHAARANYDKSMATAGKLSGAGTKALMAGTAINAAAAIPVIAYAKAEDSATQLKVALMTSGGKIHEQFQEINDLAERLGNRLPGTTSDYQDMMTMLLRQGMPVKALLGGLGEATAYLAVQLKMAPTAAAEFASKLQDATRATDKEMMGLMDTIQKTYYLGVDQNNMLQGFAKLSPALSILRTEGLAAAKALAPLLVMADQSGMVGEAAGNAYRKIFQMSLDAKKVAKANAALSGTGIKLDFSNGKGEFGGLENMYTQLERLKGVDTQRRLAVLRKIFGDDAETLQALTIMIEKGADGYRQVQAKMEAQANIQERVNLQLKTLKNLWDAATGTFTNALVAFGESIAPELHATAEWLGRVAEATQRWAKENPGLSAALMHLVKWAGMLVLALGGLLIAASAILAPLVMMKFGLAAIGVSGSAAAAGVWALLRPVLMIGSAFAVGYAIGTLLDEKLSALVSRIAGYKTNLGGFVFDVIQAFKNGEWSKIGGWILAGFEAGLDLLSGGLYSKVKEIAGNVVAAAKSALGIKSPSRVFAQIGSYTMEGLEQGILGGKDGPLGAIMDTAKRITAIGAGMLVGGSALAGELPSIDARPAMAAMSSMAPMQVTINIYPQPGQSPEEIGREVARQLQQLEGQRAARGRSRLADSE